MTRSDQKRQEEIGVALTVERCFNKLKNARRIATRYDKTAESFIDITSIRLWLRHLST